MAAAAMPVIMQHNMTTISILRSTSIGISIIRATSTWFPLDRKEPRHSRAASSSSPRRSSRSRRPSRSSPPMPNFPNGTRENATAGGFKIIYDQSYSPSTTDFAPVMRAVQAANPDIVFVAAYPPDTVGIVRAAAEIGLTPKMFGGTMIGLLITPIKTQLGPLLDGIVIMESFVPAPNFNFPGVTNVLKRYQAKA